MVAAAQVKQEDELLLITSGGTMVRTRVKEVPTVGRNTKGVRLLSLQEGENLVGVEPVSIMRDMSEPNEADTQSVEPSEGE